MAFEMWHSQIMNTNNIMKMKNGNYRPSVCVCGCHMSEFMRTVSNSDLIDEAFIKSS